MELDHIEALASRPPKLAERLRSNRQSAPQSGSTARSSFDWRRARALRSSGHGSRPTSACPRETSRGRRPRAPSVARATTEMQWQKHPCEKPARPRILDLKATSPIGEPLARPFDPITGNGASIRGLHLDAPGSTGSRERFFTLDEHQAIAFIVLFYFVSASAARAFAAFGRRTRRGAAHTCAWNGEIERARIARSGRPHPSRGCSRPTTRASRSPANRSTIRVTRESDPTTPTVGEGTPRGARVRQSRRSSAGRVRSPHGRPDRFARGARRAPTRAGRFCFRAKLVPKIGYRAHLGWRGTNLVDAADRRYRVRSLAPSARPRVRSDAAHRVARRSREDDVRSDGASRRRREHARGDGDSARARERTKDELARAMTDGSGRARFAIEAQRFGPPGPGELRVSFVGNESTPRSLRTPSEIERHAKVTLPVARARKGRDDAAGARRRDSARRRRDRPIVWARR